MNKQQLILIAFGAMVLFQLGMPLRTIITQERNLSRGELFRFKTQPIDPSDPFRGKYVTLNFVPIEDQLLGMIATEERLHNEQEVFLLLGKGAEDYALAKGISSTPPEEKENYLTTTVEWVDYQNDTLTNLRLRYPFTRYYLEESKAPRAEARYQEATRQDSLEAYALVKIYQGDAVLVDVIVGGQSLGND